MKTVHVIGATGHIGSYLCPHLMQAGYKVTGYSRGLTQPYASFEQKYLDCLVTADREQAIDMAVEAGADVICDLIPYTEGDAQYLCERILNSTKKKDTRVISIGSIWIYGNKVNHMLTEDDPRNAVDDYGNGREANIEYLGYKDFLLSLDEEDAVVSAEHIDRSPNISMEKAREVLGFESIYSEEDTLLEAIDSIFK